MYRLSSVEYTLWMCVMVRFGGATKRNGLKKPIEQDREEGAKSLSFLFNMSRMRTRSVRADIRSDFTIYAVALRSINIRNEKKTWMLM